MITITRRLEFDAGHRVYGHESKCAHIHGHRYVVELTVTAPKLDSIGRVIDFSCLKGVVGGWIDREWDHNMLLNSEDPLVESVEQDAKDQDLEKRPFVFINQNPTAEVMAEFLGRLSIELLKPYGIEVVSVQIYETPNCWALWRADSLVFEIDAIMEQRTKDRLRTMRDPR